jgi:hypothetical protein
MNRLLDFQRIVASAVMSPLNAPISGQANELVKPNDRLTSTERLKIYHRQYWYRILDSFNEDFPGLCAILGNRAFERLSRAYLSECPSQSFTLRNLGSRLENWLREHPEFASRNLALALDMIRLEWAHVETFDSGERKPLGPEDLLELGPELVIALQPHIRLLELQYPVDELRIKIGSQPEEQGRASNAVAAPASRRPVAHRYARLKPQQIFLAVHRVEFTVFYRRLDPQEFALLRAFSPGRSIVAALENNQAEPAMIQTWFANWAQLSWLCQGDQVHATTPASLQGSVSVPRA